MARAQLGKQSAGSSSEPIYEMAHRVVQSWRLDRSSLAVDVGGGSGNFARRLASEFDCVHIVDHEVSTTPSALTYIAGDLNQRWPVRDGAYDIAVALEVIEHIENPRHFMREMFRILKSDGRCLITTPNQLSLSSKICLVVRDQFRDFSDNCYPAHITALVKQDLVRIAKETGLEVCAIVYTDDGRIPFSRHSWQSMLPFLGGKWFSDNIGINLLKPD